MPNPMLGDPCCRSCETEDVQLRSTCGSAQILLLVMNATVMDVTDDELQLLAVEELLPLSGPSSVSVFGRRQDGSPPTQSAATAPAGSRKLLAGQQPKEMHRTLLAIKLTEGRGSKTAAVMTSHPG